MPQPDTRCNFDTYCFLPRTVVVGFVSGALAPFAALLDLAGDSLNFPQRAHLANARRPCKHKGLPRCYPMNAHGLNGTLYCPQSPRASHIPWKARHREAERPPLLLPLFLSLIDRGLIAPRSRKVTVKDRRYRLEICTLAETVCPYLETPGSSEVPRGRTASLSSILFLLLQDEWEGAAWHRTCSLLKRGTRNRLVCEVPVNLARSLRFLALSQASENDEMRPLPS